MKLEPTEVDGAYLIHGDRFFDQRGFVAPLWSRQEFAALGIDAPMTRVALLASARRGTLRGMHWQIPPDADAKLVGCMVGAIHDVIVDIREGSPTYGRSVGVRLAADEGAMLYCPPGCAHGFVSLTENAQVLLMASGAHAPDHARGARWDDPAFDIAWPIQPTVVSGRDESWPRFGVESNPKALSCDFVRSWAIKSW
jgi:dTDP-4-dehydrorhamnose 3,5-epimerase